MVVIDYRIRKTGNSVKNCGARSFSEMLKINTALTELDMSGENFATLLLVIILS